MYIQVDWYEKVRKIARMITKKESVYPLYWKWFFE